MRASVALLAVLAAAGLPPACCWRWGRAPTTHAVNDSTHGSSPFYGAASARLLAPGVQFIHGGAESVAAEESPRSDASILDASAWSWCSWADSLGPRRFAGGAIAACNDSRVILWGGAGPNDDENGALATVVEIRKGDGACPARVGGWRTLRPASARDGHRPRGLALFGSAVVSAPPAGPAASAATQWTVWLVVFGRRASHPDRADAQASGEHWLLWVPSPAAEPLAALPEEAPPGEAPRGDAWSVCDDFGAGDGVGGGPSRGAAERLPRVGQATGGVDQDPAGGLSWERPGVVCSPLPAGQRPPAGARTDGCPRARFGHAMALLPRAPLPQARGPRQGGSGSSRAAAGGASRSAASRDASQFVLMYGGFDGVTLFSDAWLGVVEGGAASGNRSGVATSVVWSILDATHGGSLRQYGAAAVALRAASASAQLTTSWLSGSAGNEAAVPAARRALFLTLGGLHHEHGAGDALDALDVDRRMWFAPAAQGQPPRGRMLPTVLELWPPGQDCSASGGAPCLATLGGMRQGGRSDSPAESGAVAVTLTGVGYSEGGMDEWVLVVIAGAAVLGALGNQAVGCVQRVAKAGGCFATARRCCRDASRCSCLGLLSSVAYAAVWLVGCTEMAESCKRRSKDARADRERGRRAAAAAARPRTLSGGADLDTALRRRGPA